MWVKKLRGKTIELPYPPPPWSCSCLLVVVNRTFSIYLNSYLAQRLGGIKQKKMCYSLLSLKIISFVFSSKPRSQV